MTDETSNGGILRYSELGRRPGEAFERRLQEGYAIVTEQQRGYDLHAAEEIARLRERAERAEAAVEKVRALRDRLANAPQGDGFPPDGSVWLLDQVLRLFDEYEGGGP